MICVIPAQYKSSSLLVTNSIQSSLILGKLGESVFPPLQLLRGLPPSFTRVLSVHLTSFGGLSAYLGSHVVQGCRKAG